MKRILPTFLTLLSAPLMAAESKVDFNYDIRPLISSKCYHCHGPDEKSRKAELRLDLREEAIKEHESGRTIVPGDPQASELMKRITSKDRDEVMPPPKEEHPLAPHEVELFRRWIAEGAEYKAHWSFVKPARPPVPGIADCGLRIADLEKRDPKRAAELRQRLPEIERWPRNAIDHFVLARMLEEGLAPSPEADPAALIRRLSLDLIGLPPTPEEVSAFTQSAIRNPQSAIENAVDRLLVSPAFGERWAKMWLDLARYADSKGYGSDPFRLNIWPYRDWVINAFNRNLPYDQFTIEQLAGDLLPNATTEQITATAFHRNTMTNTEGGTNDEEWRVAAVKDRIATTGQVWMGLTVGCAQCHTHKFDPISHRDYYRFYGIFNQTEDNDLPDDQPTMPIPTAEELRKMEALRQEIAAIEGRMKARSAEFDAEQVTWEKQVSRPAEWHPLTAHAVTTASGITLAAQADGSLLAIGTERPESDTYTLTVKSELRGITALRVEALTDDSLPANGPGRSENGNAVLSELRALHGPVGAKPPRGRYVRVTVPNAPTGLALAEVQVFSGGQNIALKGVAAQSSTGFGGEAKRANDGKTEGDFAKNSVSHTNAGKDQWWEVDLKADAEIEGVTIWNRTGAGMPERLKDFRVSVLDAEHKPVWEETRSESPKPSLALNPGGAKTVPLRNASADFSQAGFGVAAALDGDPKTGWAWANELGKPHAAVFEFTQPLDAAGGDLTLVLRQEYGTRHTIGRFRISATTQKPPPRELAPATKAILAIDPPQRTPPQREELSAFFRPISKRFADLGKQLEAKRAELAGIKPVTLPVLRELAQDKRRETRILTKGNYLSPGDKVDPGLIEEFASHVPANTKMDRLAAARWLMSAENPLTARVAVNRFWAQLFGTGIVETEEDFGSQGSLPSHPELLDWLAVAFISPKSADASQLSLGWNVKALLKLIVTSATYRQASNVTPAMLEKDARNRLLAHAPRRRLDAETVRDQALALSGLLSRKLGGPSVYPPQPDGLWKVAFNGGQNAYPTSKGEDRYRRGLYTFWRRTMPNPSMVTFDAPSREFCTMRRLPTNTPLQAFVTMNDPVFVECSQALARRLVSEGGAEPAARIRFGLRLCTGRPAADAHVQALTALYENELATYRADAAGALKLATQPLGPLPAGADAAELAAWTVVANVLLNLDAVLTKN